MSISIRAELVALALEWEKQFGVAPSITSAVSEYDAALLVGCPDPAEVLKTQTRTAVTSDFDFIFCGNRYQIKANRPSGKPGSNPSKVGKPSRYDWDFLIWMLYDRQYVLLEAWLWTANNYRKILHNEPYIRPKHMRGGTALFINGEPNMDAISHLGTNRS